MRKPTRNAVLASLALLAAGAIVFGLWMLRGPTGTRGATAEEVSVPDLAGWPEEFVTRVRRAAGASSLAELAELGRLYHANGFSAEAERVWRSLIMQEPTEARWPYYLANVREPAGDLREVEALLNTVVQHAPDYVPAHLKLAELLFKQGRIDDAAAHYERRLQLVSGDPYARLGLARVALERAQNPAAVLQHLEDLVQEHPHFPSALNLLAELCAQTGDIARAGQLRRRGHDAGRFREAADPWLEELDVACYDPYQLQVLGARRMQTGRVAESLPFYEKSVRLAPTDGPAHEALGDVYLRLGRLDDARRTLEAGIAVAPKTESLYSRFAEVCRQQDKPADAIGVLERGIRVLPAIAELRSDLGVALEAVGRREEAIAAYHESIRLNPALPTPRLNLGLCLLAAGRLEEAHVTLTEVLELHPGQGKALLALGQLELGRDNLVGAEEPIRRLYALQPDRAEARELFALWHVRSAAREARSGRTADAERLIREGLAAVPEYGELHGNLGVLHAQAGRYAEAVEAFSSFVPLLPESAQARLYLGQALIGAGRRDDARRVLQQASDIARQSNDESTLRHCEQLLAGLR